MPGLELLYLEAGVVINNLIREEFEKQGHTLTGAYSRSLDSKISKTSLIGYGEAYGKIINEGIKPEDVSERMMPGLINYFKLRGYNDNAAAKFAVLTFHRWKKEGVSTVASNRFSKTGERHHFIEKALNNPIIDKHMILGIDKMVDDLYHRTKSETV